MTLSLLVLDVVLGVLKTPAISALGSSDRRVGNSKPASIYWGGRQSRLLETVSKAEKILKILVLTCF